MQLRCAAKIDDNSSKKDDEYLASKRMFKQSICENKIYSMFAF